MARPGNNNRHFRRYTPKSLLLAPTVVVINKKAKRTGQLGSSSSPDTPARATERNRQKPNVEWESGSLPAGLEDAAARHPVFAAFRPCPCALVYETAAKGACGRRTWVTSWLIEQQYHRQKFASNEVKSESCKLVRNHSPLPFVGQVGPRGVCVIYPNEIEINAFVFANESPKDSLEHPSSYIDWIVCVIKLTA